MYCEFAYSGTMQIILAVIAFISSYAIMYMIANLMSQLFGVKTGRRQKAIFALLIGTILNQIWVYLIYFIKGMESFSEILYTLVVTPNPVFALFYYVIGVKVLKLSPLRSIKLMSHVYLYYIIIKCLSRLLSSIFFVQPSERYNYMLDALDQIVFTTITIAIYFATKYLLKHYNQVIKLRDSLFINFKRELLIYFIKSVVIYFLMVGLPIFLGNKIAVNFIIMTMLTLIFMLSLLWDVYNATRNYVENRDVYINILMREFLVTREKNIYAMKERINDNPSLVSILLNKYEHAEKHKVNMYVSSVESLNDFNMDNIDVCRIISCLLDNAIDTAAESGGSEKKWVCLVIEPKADSGSLIIVNNSMAVNAAILYAHRERISVVSEIIEKYGNCTFQLSCYNDEMSAYFEIK